MRPFPGRAPGVVVDVVPAAVLIKPHLPSGRKRLFRNWLRGVVRRPVAGGLDHLTATAIAGADSTEMSNAGLQYDKLIS